MLTSKEGPRSTTPDIGDTDPLATDAGIPAAFTRFDRDALQLTGAYSVIMDKVMNENVLIIDDLYRSGATLEAVANVLRNVGRARKVFALTFTRTRSKR
jgi:phosphoribosylpyrophosphate synthetase